MNKGELAYFLLRFLRFFSIKRVLFKKILLLLLLLLLSLLLNFGIAATQAAFRIAIF